MLPLPETNITAYESKLLLCTFLQNLYITTKKWSLSSKCLDDILNCLKNCSNLLCKALEGCLARPITIFPNMGILGTWEWGEG